MSELKAPFPWFGGKRRVADIVWRELGDCDNYVEPFAGSLAVLLGRPDSHDRKAETVNDADNYLVNLWRAMHADPEEVAYHADWPVNECDLLSRHLWLVEKGRERIKNLEADPEFYDAKVAGWWVWGINSWIGSGWCQGNGPWRVVNGEVVNTGDKGGQWRQLPHLGTAGQGVNRKLPHLGNAGQGVNRKLPHLGNAGQGVNRKRPHLGNAGQGVNRKRPNLPNRKPSQHLCGRVEVKGSLVEYFTRLAERLRKVRVCCGDWSRVLTNGATSYGESVGVFLDPPYLGDVRAKDLYRVDDHSISHDVRKWCLEHGDDKRFRIVLAGYSDEHDAEIPDTWRRHRYSASKCYGTTAAVGKGEGNDTNRHNEVLWFSPGCLGGVSQKSLF